MDTQQEDKTPCLLPQLMQAPQPYRTELPGQARTQPRTQLKSRKRGPPQEDLKWPSTTWGSASRSRQTPVQQALLGAWQAESMVCE